MSSAGTELTTFGAMIRFAASLEEETANRYEAWAVRVGEPALAFFEAENRGEAPVVGTATFNVTPQSAGAYFNKIDCFCFTEQTLAPGRAVDMPVSFFVDPEMADDRNLDDVTAITLSYTFFKAQKQALGSRAETENATTAALN